MNHATYGALMGDEAVFKVLRWTGGNFETQLRSQDRAAVRNSNTQGLLMEGLRLLDESNRGEGELEPQPEPPAQEAAPSEPPAQHATAHEATSDVPAGTEDEAGEEEDINLGEDEDDDFLLD